MATATLALSRRHAEVRGEVTADRAAIPRAVPGIALLAAVLASAWGWFTNSLTLYGDARAHMDVARHITDSLSPGLAQVGTVWLPVPHLLMSPLVAVDVLWHSAAAGAIVGGLCFVYSAVRLFGLAQEWLGSNRCAWVAFAVYVSNVNLLYVQSTALTEPVLLAFFVGTVYHLARWTRTLSHRDLIIAAVMTSLATMTRYDGWFLLAAGFTVVVAWSWLRERRASATEANILLFGIIGAFGLGLWVLYNLIIFHDPLAFIHSSFSAQSQQTTLQNVGVLSTKGSMRESVITYGYAVFHVAGPALVILGTLGTLVLLASRQSRRSRDLAILALLVSPLLFNVLALWSGQSTLRVPERPPFGMWNIRYGLMALPLLALGAGALVRRVRLAAVAVTAVTAAAAAGIVFMVMAVPITLADGRTGTSSAAGGRTERVAAYLGSHYHGGRVLADEASSAPLIYASTLNLREFVTIGYHPYYEDALVHPAGEVAWVIAYDGDAMDVDIHSHPDRFANFVVVANDGRAHLLRRVSDDGLSGPMTLSRFAAFGFPGAVTERHLRPH